MKVTVRGALLILIEGWEYETQIYFSWLPQVTGGFEPPFNTSMQALLLQAFDALGFYKYTGLVRQMVVNISEMGATANITLYAVVRNQSADSFVEVRLLHMGCLKEEENCLGTFSELKNMQSVLWSSGIG